jgi:hypothetical protein
VTGQEVAGIIGQPVERTVLAVLGPTCLYVLRAAPAGYVPAQGHGHAMRPKRAQLHGIEVTLAVAPMNFRTATARLRTPTAFTVSGHRAYCGLTGHPIAVVSLTYGRVMTIAAPCPLAALIAKAALRRL